MNHMQSISLGKKEPNIDIPTNNNNNNTNNNNKNNKNDDDKGNKGKKGLIYREKSISL